MPINSFLYPAKHLPVGFEVANSLRFDGASSAYLSKTFGSSGNRKTFTISFWVKKCELASNPDTMSDAQMLFGGQQSSYPAFNIIFLHTNDTIFFKDAQAANDIQISIKSDLKFRDPSAWYHVVFAIDTTQSTASNRAKLYINGVQQTDLAGENASGGASDNPLYPDQNQDLQYNSNTAHYINKYATNYEDMYMAEYVFIDGSALAPTSFGEFDEDSGIWKPIDVSGLTFGTNGFYLDFEDSSSLGNDAAGSNNWTTNNIAATDQSIDTCTNNFCTLNPLSKGTITLAEGNLQWQGSGDNGGKGTFLMTKGKWYWEMKRADSQDNVGLGVAVSNWTNSVDAASGEAWYGYQGQAYKVSGGGEVSYGATFTNGDIISCLFNADDGILAFYKNGASQGNAYTGLTNSDGYVPIYFTYRSSVTNYMNFGSPIHSISSGNSDGNGYGNFEYAVPSGYYALNTKNLAEYG